MGSGTATARQGYFRTLIRHEVLVDWGHLRDMDLTVLWHSATRKPMLMASTGAMIQIVLSFVFMGVLIEIILSPALLACLHDFALVPCWTYLENVAIRQSRMLADELCSTIHVPRLKDEHAAELFFGFGIGAVGRCHLCRSSNTGSGRSPALKPFSTGPVALARRWSSYSKHASNMAFRSALVMPSNLPLS